MNESQLLDMYLDRLPIAMEGKCATCRYWEELEPPQDSHVVIRDETDPAHQFGVTMDWMVEEDMWDLIVPLQGWCKRMPPSLPTQEISDDQGDPYHACWPATGNGDWCGEHKPAEPTR